ncbi:hypothetical protein EV361DRAFT_870741 [Lentinula raphanica]|nr:hypothetical protein F5880DRAFT_1503487 [Lentinula raphanica]KAJ3968581.1 hypothetical protein EV361DRAFT_870741 [Lentinula raphanica]
MFQLPSSSAGLPYPSSSSSVFPWQKPFNPHSIESLSGGGHRSVHTRPNAVVYQAGWNVWGHDLSSNEGIEVHSFPQSSFEGCVPGDSQQIYSNTKNSKITKASSENHGEISQRSLAITSTEAPSRICETDNNILPKLVHLVERARERSHFAHEVYTVGTCPTIAMVGRSNVDSSLKCASAAESPCINLPTDVVMDSESNMESPSRLSGQRSETLPTDSAQSLMPSIRSSSSSSSAQSSPLCVTPELPTVSIPFYPRAVPASYMSEGDSPSDKANVDAYQLESLVARMTLHRRVPSNDNKSLNTLYSHSKNMSTPSPSSSAASLSESNSTRRADHGPSYLSRSQRRLARTVVNPCHDVQSYLYEGGRTGVVSGGVMLGPQVPVAPSPGKNSVQKPTSDQKSQRREQRSRRKTKKGTVQEDRPPIPKVVL